ncbi:MAG: hypothetical protein ABWX96_13580 [Propionibacteriaceae bacterium]
MLFSRWPVYERVLVNLVDGAALDAVLVAQKGDLLILAEATLHGPEHEPTVLDGEVYIERTRVQFIQVRPT